jgi:hypothetical protein
MGWTQIHRGGNRSDEMVWRQRLGRQVFIEAVKGFRIIGIDGVVKEGLEV